MKNNIKRALTLLLALVMVLGVTPLTAIAEGTTGSVTNYADFMTNLKVLEGYASAYTTKLINKDAGELVLNFIRTGVERYQDDNWETLAGVEDEGFTIFVKEQDAANGTAAMNLKNIVIDDFTVPNGNKVDFGHMFGCMNISYVNKGSADLSGWAGDICDLLDYCVDQKTGQTIVPSGTVDEMAAYIQEKCFGVSASGAFGWDDFWGDMDAYYLVNEYKKGNGSFSALIEAYFTEALNDTDRTVYFMNNRFAVADSQEAVRKALYESYSSDVSIKILESKRGLSSYNKLREACVYAVADYIYSQAKGKLIEGTVGDDAAVNGYYTVFNNEHSVLAPGITQDINYAQTVDGKQIVYYVATVDVTREDVTIMVNYKDNEPPVAGEHIGLQSVPEQVKALVKNNSDKGHFYPIVATNGAGYNITNGTPSGLVFMQGVEYYPVNAPGFFAILKNGSAMIGTKEDYAALSKEDIQEGIQAFGYVLVKDGKVCVTKNANHTSSRASRTAIGIREDGSVVMMVLDGRQLPYSAGGSIEEIAQIMLEAGCVQAVNLDGGGSTTYMSKPAGSDEIQVVNRPSDGYVRSVATSLVAVSTAAPSTAFDHSIISSDYEYITVGTQMQFSVTGVSNTGNAAEIPADSYWRVSDTSIGSIDANGLFTAIKNGTVDVEYIVNGEVENKVTIGVVVPDSLSMESTSMTAIYGKSATLPIRAYYQNNRVCVKDSDFYAVLQYSNAGTVNGLDFIPSEAAGYRNFLAGAMLLANQNLYAYLTVNLYREDETIFDFENATFGNRTLAWTREITNTHTFDDLLYRVSDEDTPVEMEYTFALDMKAINIPTRLEPMIFKLPTYQANATAWDYMLQMANRVCEQTEVTIIVDFSRDVEVDISELKIVNDFFRLTDAILDENNRLIVVCNWVYQPASIDPSAANPLCLLTGVKTTLKDTAAFYNDEIIISNNGTVSYKIYLGAGSLYSFTNDPVNDAQNLYGLYPYDHGSECKVTGDTAGGYFSDVYVDFADTYAITTEKINGWHEDYYYVNNAPVTGVQLVPDRHDSTQKRFYEFDENGKIVNEQGMTGLIEHEGNLYYPAKGVVRTGWWEIDGKFYYFNLDTGAAVDGKYTIRESKNSWQTADFEYTFENHVLVKGAWLEDAQSGYSGWRYRWAGDWIVGEWFEVEGKWYFSNKNEYGYVRTGYQHYIPSKEDTNATKCYLFDGRGALMTDFKGAVYIESRDEYRYFVAGTLYSTIGFARGDDGYYYHVTGSGVVSTNTNVTVNEIQGHGLVPAGTYHVDKYGRFTEALIEKDNIDVNEDVIGKGDITVQGKVITVTVSADTPACKVVYQDSEGNYVCAEVTQNSSSSYSFAAGSEADEVKIIVTGDTDGNGKVETDDVTALQQDMLGKKDAGAAGKLAGDLNGDGKLSIADLVLLNAASKGKTNLGW